MNVNGVTPLYTTETTAPSQPETSSGQSFAAVLASATQAVTSANHVSSTADQGSVTESATADTPFHSSASEEFHDYMSKSDADKIREAILREMGLTEEEFQQLPPEEQLEIQREVVERMKERSGVTELGFTSSVTDYLR